jgi:hypothetical protein
MNNGWMVVGPVASTWALVASPSKVLLAISVGPKIGESESPGRVELARSCSRVGRSGCGDGSRWRR